MEYQNFSSLPPEQERSFVVYERTSVEAGKKALTFGVISGLVFGVFVIALVFSFDAPENAHATKAPPTKVGAAEDTPKPAPAPEAVVPTETAPAAATDPAATAPVAAPAPAPGTTKAPPTALTGE